MKSGKIILDERASRLEQYWSSDPEHPLCSVPTARQRAVCLVRKAGAREW